MILCRENVVSKRRILIRATIVNHVRVFVVCVVSLPYPPMWDVPPSMWDVLGLTLIKLLLTLSPELFGVRNKRRIV